MIRAETDIELAEAYFTPQYPEFWRWSEAGCREIEGTWQSPSLIIFRGELTRILAELQPQGWPALPALLMLCAATRDNWPQSRPFLEMTLATAHPHRRGEYVEGLNRLDRVHRLPKAMRESTAAKIELARMVFEGSRPHLFSYEAAAALRYLQSIIPYRHPTSWKTDLDATLDDQFVEQTRSLWIGLPRVSRSALESRIQTGFEQNVLPADVSAPDDAGTFGARLARWTTDAELFAVARIARQLISILSWPRAVSEPDDISLGGISDLTNTGPLDRLLLSELAHDDDILAVRIALKEALYVRRESPTNPTARRRAVLIDTSLRLWGCPRIYAAAVALALAAAQDHEPELSVSVDVTDLDNWKSVDLSTRAGAVEVLSCLSPFLHPAESVVAWSGHAIPDEIPCDPILITTAETLAEPQFQLALNRLPAEFHAALVSADGRFELRRHTVHGWHTMRTACLDLEELLEPPADSRPLPLARRGADRLPVILRTDPFPLRLTHPLEPGHVWILPGNIVLSQASGNRLMLWDGPEQAARQLATEIPPGRMEAAHANYRMIDSRMISPLAGPIITLIVRGKSWHLIRFNLSTRELQSRSLESTLQTSDQAIKVLLTAQAVFLIARHSIQAFSPESGEFLSELPVDKYHPLECVGHQYLRDDQARWHHLGFDGKINLTPVKEHNLSLMLVEPPFGDVPAKDGPWCLPCSRGQKIHNRTVPAFQETQLERICQRGSLVMLHGRFSSLEGIPHNYPVTAVWDLEEPRWTWRVEYSPVFDIAVRNQALIKIRPRQNLRHKFTTLDCGGNRICLKSSRQWWQLMLRNEKLKLSAVPLIVDHAGQSTFEKQSWPGISISFRSTTLPNGNAVWLDGRGLMHLLPARSDLPEVTLVLDEDDVSGWISNGTCFGDHYYHEAGTPIPLERAWHDHIAPFFGVAP